jgi:hypothetical protein
MAVSADVARLKKLLYGDEPEPESRLVEAAETSGPHEPISAPKKAAVVKYAEVKARAKYTPEIAQKIISVVQAGNTREVACASAGVSLPTLTAWAKFAANNEEPFTTFLNLLDKTEAGLEAVLVAIIRQKAQEDPNIAFKLLERRFPQRWAQGATPAVNINMAQQNQMTPADARAVMRDLFGDLSPKQVIDAPAEDGSDET